MAKDKIIISGGVDEYIASCPVEAQPNLQKIRSAVKEIAPDAVETTSYFGIAGYAYEGHDYNGMFVWFSYKGSDVRLHLRPPVIDDHKAQLKGISTTKSIVSFPNDTALPLKLIKELVEASLKVMRGF